MRVDLAQLEFVCATLREIVLELEETAGFELVVTSLYRIGDSGVHGALPLRGIDIRVRVPGVGALLEKSINNKWVYDPERPEMACAILHGVGANLHLHIQTHPHTIRRLED